MTTAAFPGTFDPITLGHVDIVRRAAGLFDQVIVAVGANPQKQRLFTAQERLALAQDALGDIDNATAEPFDGLLIDFLRARDIHVVVRGLRTAGDFDYERAMAFTNGSVLPDLETVFLAARPELSALNARLIKEIAVRAEDLSAFVPERIAEALHAKLHDPGRTV